MKKATKQDLEKELYKKYPWVFSGRHEPITQNLMPFGMEISTGGGWMKLIEILASSYEHSMKSDWQHYPLVKFVQIKEKFGGLRAYIHCTPMNEDQYKQRWLAHEQQRREKWYKDEPDKWEEYDPKEYQEYLVRAKEGAITFQAWEHLAESLSYHICEDCGTMDDVTTNDRGWISTLCTSCRKARESEKAWWRPRNIRWHIRCWFKYTLPDILKRFKRKEKPENEKDHTGEPPPGNK